MTLPPNKTPLLLGLIGLLTLVLYAPSLQNGFAMDDCLVVRPMLDDVWPNEMVHDVRPLGDYFTQPYHHGSGQLSELYRPLTVLTYAVVNALQRQPVDPVSGAQPHHALNVLLHLAATVLVFVLLRRMGAWPAPALAGALVFGVHAIHSEAVANIVGRAELMGFCLGAGGLLLCVEGLTSPRRGAWWLGIAGALLLFLAFCSKENALAWVPFTAVFCVARRWQMGDSAYPGGLRGWATWRTAVVAVGVAAAVAAYWHLRSAMLAALPEPPPVPEYVANPLAHVDAGTRIGTAIVLWGMGLWKTLAPTDCCADYWAVTFDLVTSAADPRLLAAAAVLGVFLLAGIVFGRRQPLLFLAVAAFFGFGLITSNIPRPIGTIFGERLYYAPSFAASCLVAWLVDRGLGRFGGCRVLLVAWVLVSAGVVLERNPVWKDDSTLFLHEATCNPKSVRMLVCAASVRLDEGRLDDACELLERAVELLPGYALAWNNLGAVLLDLDRLPEAEQALRKAEEAEYPLVGRHRAMVHGNLASVLEGLDRRAEARAELEKALQLDPGNRDLRRRLSELDAGEPPAVPRRAR